MTPERDIGKVLERWFVDGVDQMPDRVFLTILDRVDREPQRRLWRLRSWRFPPMPTPIKLVAIGAVLLAVLLGGAVFLGGGAGPGPTPAPTPTPSPTPSPSPSSSPAPQRVGMDLQGETASYTVVVPAGWTGAGGWAMTKSQGHGAPTGIGFAASGAVNVPSDPCDGIGKVSDAASPTDVVTELEARDDLVVSDAVDTTLGGFPALRVDVEFPAVSACADLSFLFAEPDGSGVYAQGLSNRFQVWIVDIGDRPVVFWIDSFAGTPAADLAEAQQIMDSVEITP